MADSDSTTLGCRSQAADLSSTAGASRRDVRNPMLFEPLYYGDRLTVINPAGDVGVATLWSKVEQVLQALERFGIDLSPATSRIAVVANLYGDGLPQMLRNLAWNPQISSVVTVGQDLSGSADDLQHFLARDVDEATVLGRKVFRITGTGRLIDTSFDPDLLAGGVGVLKLGKLSDEHTRKGLVEFFRELPPQIAPERPRKRVPMPEVSFAHYPSEPRSHSIVRRTPLDAWEEIVFRIMRFGRRVELKKGQRIELQNLKVVVTEPRRERDEDLVRYGYSPERFRSYEKAILDPSAPPDLSYTYGNRLRAHFVRNGEAVDSLDTVVELLRRDPDSRHAYAALWDAAFDLPMRLQGEHHSPCLCSLFFRVFEGKLTLTAVYRTHNAMRAWLENVYGLMALQRYVAERIETAAGALTVISHSITIDPQSSQGFAVAQAIADGKSSDDELERGTGKRTLREDPNGYFVLSLDAEAGEIVAEHKYEGLLLKQYRGKRADLIEAEIARDGAVSLISHALYLGRELAKKEAELVARNRR